MGELARLRREAVLFCLLRLLPYGRPAWAGSGPEAAPTMELAPNDVLIRAAWLRALALDDVR